MSQSFTVKLCGCVLGFEVLACLWLVLVLCTLDEQGHNLPLWGTDSYIYLYLILPVMVMVMVLNSACTGPLLILPDMERDNSCVVCVSLVCPVSLGCEI